VWHRRLSFIRRGLELPRAAGGAGRDRAPVPHRSDTEVVLHAYLEWSEDLADHLNGMYAIWDTRTQSGPDDCVSSKEPRHVPAPSSVADEA
jgi:hypothetical protein